MENEQSRTERTVPQDVDELIFGTDARPTASRR